jgi:hypothetical protein
VSAASRSRWASVSAFLARIACQVLTTTASTSRPANPAAVPSAARCLRANFRSRYMAARGPASTGSPSRCRRTSRANPLAVSYRRDGSFSSAFITIQSRSPRTSFASFDGSVAREAAIDAISWVGPSRELGLGGSSSRTRRSISVNAASLSRPRSSGVPPVKSS